MRKYRVARVETPVGQMRRALIDTKRVAALGIQHRLSLDCRQQSRARRFAAYCANEHVVQVAAQPLAQSNLVAIERAADHAVDAAADHLGARALHQPPVEHNRHRAAPALGAKGLEHAHRHVLPAAGGGEVRHGIALDGVGRIERHQRTSV